MLTAVKEMKHSFRCEIAGKQCVAISLTLIILYNHIGDIDLWTFSTLNNILTIRNILYNSIRCSVETNDYLLLTDVPCIVSIYNLVRVRGSLFMRSNNNRLVTELEVRTAMT